VITIKRAYKKEMKRIIVTVKNNQTVNVDSDFTAECLGTCIRRGYIVGYCAKRNANGDYLFDVVNPKVTLEGLDYISMKINWTYVISLIALIVSILAFLQGVFIC